MDQPTPLKSTPKDVFLQLFNIVTFYLCIIGFIMLYVQYISVSFPDKLNYYFSNISDIVRVASSILLISAPSFVLSAWLLAKDIKSQPEKRHLSLRKWLTYFTLFLSAITIIIDLMIFVYNFFNGELTIQFFLKVLVVLLVAVAVFGYYLWELKRVVYESKTPKMLAISMLVVVFGSIVIGFFIVGTPSAQRDRRFDEQRIGDLQTIQYQVADYWRLKNSLPKTLISIDGFNGYLLQKDPETKNEYEYQVKSDLSFSLCANFSRSTMEGQGDQFRNEEYAVAFGPYDKNMNWDHGVGRHCFEKTIDPDLYANDPARIKYETKADLDISTPTQIK